MSRISKGQIRAELELMLAKTGDERFRSAIEAMEAHGLLGRGRGRPRLSDAALEFRVHDAQKAALLVMLSEVDSTRKAFAAVARDTAESAPERRRRTAQIKRDYYRILPRNARPDLSRK